MANLVCITLGVPQEYEILKSAANIDDDKEEEESGSLWKEFLEPEAYKPLGLLLLLFALQQLCGVYAVINYSNKIFKSFLSGELKPKLANVSVNALRVGGSILAVVFMKRKFSNKLQVHIKDINRVKASITSALH